MGYRIMPLDNNLYFLCGLIEKLGRDTKNKKSYIVSQIGKERLKKIYELSDVLHCENIESVCMDFINSSNIETGNVDIRRFSEEVPHYWDIAHVYRRLISNLEGDLIDNVLLVYTSWICDYIDNYDKAFYYMPPGYHLDCFLNGEIVEMS